MAIASASHWVRCTKSAACATSVSNCSRVMVPSAPWPSSLSPFMVSSEPSTPSSASTVTPMACEHFTRHFHVVFVGSDRFTVGFQRTVHHDGREARADGAHADGWRLAMVLMHDNRNVWVGFDGSVDQVAQEGFASVLARASGRLHDHRAVERIGGSHDGLHLLQVIDVESRDAITVFGGMVQQLTHGYERHGNTPENNRNCCSASRLMAAPAPDLIERPTNCSGLGALPKAVRLVRQGNATTPWTVCSAFFNGIRLLLLFSRHSCHRPAPSAHPR